MKSKDKISILFIVCVMLLACVFMLSLILLSNSYKDIIVYDEGNISRMLDRIHSNCGTTYFTKKIGSDDYFLFTSFRNCGLNDYNCHYLTLDECMRDR